MRTPSEIIIPGESGAEIEGQSTDEYFQRIPSGTIQIFVYDAGLIQTTPCDRVIIQKVMAI